MTAFTDLARLSSPEIVWVSVLGAFDADRVETLFYMGPEMWTGGDQPIRGGWLKGETQNVFESITRFAGKADRSFLEPQSSLSGGGTLKVVPDLQMILAIKAADLDFRGGTYRLLGWGKTKDNGDPFPFAEADVFIEGRIEKTFGKGNGILQIEWQFENDDLDQPVQKHIFGGRGAAARIITSSSDTSIGRFISSQSGMFPTFTGELTVELFGVARGIEPTVAFGTLIRLGRAQLDTNFALRIIAGRVLEFGVDLDTIATTFVLPDNGRFYVAFTVAPDGKAVTIFANLDWRADSVAVVGSGVLSSPISAPAVPELVLGEVPVGIVFPDVGGDATWDAAEFRIWTQTKTLQEIQATADKTIRADEVSGFPELVHLYRANRRFTTGEPLGPDFEDEAGLIDLFFTGIGTPGDYVSTLDGPLPDFFANEIFGQTQPLLLGVAANMPAHLCDDPRDGYCLSRVLSSLVRLRSRQAPVTTNFSLTASFVIDTTADTFTLDVSEPITQSFLPFVQPDGDLPGQIVEAVDFGNPAHNSASYLILDISEDGRTLFIDGNIGGPDATDTGTIRTPLTGVSKFQAELDTVLGGVIIDRDLLLDDGQITWDGLGKLGLGGTSAEVDGLFDALVEEHTGSPAVLNVEAGLFNPFPLGLYFPKGGSTSFRDAAWLITGAGFGWWRKETDGSYTLGTYRPPTGLPLETLTQANAIESVEELPRARPLWEFETLYRKNHQRQDQDAAAGAVPVANREEFAAAGQTALFTDREFKDRVRTSVKRGNPIGTLIFAREEAEEYRAVAAAILATDLRWYRIKCAGLWASSLRAGDTVLLKWDDSLMGLEAGKLATIANKRMSTEGTIVLEVYGGAGSETLTDEGIPVTDEGEFIHV